MTGRTFLKIVVVGIVVAIVLLILADALNAGWLAAVAAVIALALLILRTVFPHIWNQEDSG